MSPTLIWYFTQGSKPSNRWDLMLTDRQTRWLL